MLGWGLWLVTAWAADVPVEPAAPPPEPPPAASGTLDGAPITFRSARAFTEGGTAVTVSLDTSPLDCVALGQARTVSADEVGAELTLAQVLQPDGARPWKVVRTAFDEALHEGDLGPAEVSGSATDGLTVTLPSLAIDGSARKLVLAGPVTAAPCGDRPTPMFGDAATEGRAAEPAAFPGLVFTVAGQPVEVRGALLDRDPEGDTLVLSTQSLSCTAAWWSEDLVYEIAVPRKKETTAFLRGRTLPAQMTDLLDKKDGAKLSVGKAAEGRVPVTAAVAYDHTGYAVELRGTFTVPECP